MSQWTTKEVDILINHYQTKTNRELALLLPNKTRAAIRGKAERLCLSKSLGIDYTNKRIGSLVFEYRLSSKEQRGVLWRAKCDCGRQIDIVSSRVQNQKHPSCGCMRPVAFSKNPKLRTLENRLRMYKQRAKRDCIGWSLTDEEFFDIIQQNCSYCGQSPDNEINAYKTSRHEQVRSHAAQQQHKRGAIKVNGVDRINSMLGYFVMNCVPCCRYCNYAKRERSHDDFMQWINRLIEFQTS
jgi:hypothetical protein